MMSVRKIGIDGTRQAGTPQMENVSQAPSGGVGRKGKLQPAKDVFENPPKYTPTFAGWVKSIDGRNIKADVINDEIGADNIQKKKSPGQKQINLEADHASRDAVTGRPLTVRKQRRSDE